MALAPETARGGDSVPAPNAFCTAHDENVPVGGKPPTGEYA